ncbi:hypothetical protein [Rhodovulum steppense]|uniref:Uncharacterized protein n=1 Tax=Rhodovulum steppense TaxID=540251 RepID=A0A4R1YL32_9RHOB|nr:hypothetical protein [Rhodovulum steppense]TCM77823.1 hypothetical protein EV216_12832 [Rhodovulum steppense]
MQELLDWWQALVGLVAVIGVAITWLQVRRPRVDTTNVASNARRVRQTGGPGVTRNEATSSEDVDQSG